MGDVRDGIDVYPVGWCAELIRLRRTYRRDVDLPPVARRHVWRNLRRLARLSLTRALTGKWRALKNSLNGYMAEPTPWPEGLQRCGTGWTRGRALRDLNRRMRQPGILWHELGHYEVRGR